MFEADAGRAFVLRFLGYPWLCIHIPHAIADFNRAFISKMFARGLFPTSTRSKEGVGQGHEQLIG